MFATVLPNTTENGLFKTCGRFNFCISPKHLCIVRHVALPQTLQNHSAGKIWRGMVGCAILKLAKRASNHRRGFGGGFSASVYGVRSRMISMKPAPDLPRKRPTGPRGFSSPFGRRRMMRTKHISPAMRALIVRSVPLAYNHSPEGTTQIAFLLIYSFFLHSVARWRKDTRER